MTHRENNFITRDCNELNTFIIIIIIIIIFIASYYVKVLLYHGQITGLVNVSVHCQQSI